MMKRRAYEEVTIAHGGNAVTLRPSLRAATILDERYGVPALHRALDDFNLTIICEIIRVSAVKKPHTDAAAFLSGTPGTPLLPFFLSVRAPLAELVSMLNPAPDLKAKQRAMQGKSMSWAELFAALYNRATGSLGWTAEQAWNATPTEINRAYAAHIDYLFMTGVLKRDHDETAPDVDTEALSELLKSDDLDPEFDRAGLHALKAQGRKS